MTSEAPDDNAMAAAMGFSSFGSQNPQKKRKYNHRADAIYDEPPRSSGTGSNMTPLGKQKPSGLANTEEIVLDNDVGEARSVHGGPTLDTEAQSHHSGLPSRPPPPQVQARKNSGNGERKQHESRNNGKPWYEGYYDPTSNQNPWERLEKKLGLESKGSWLPKAPWTGSTTAR